LHPSNLKHAPRFRQRRIAAEPHWRPVNQFTSAALPATVRQWLTDDGSLTSRLMACGQGTFSVQRLYQGWEIPLPSERRLLAMRSRQLALVREVALRLDASAVVFARSIFPVASLVGSLGHLRSLQNKSLGAILFKHPGMHRYPFELAHMAGNNAYLPPSLQQATPVWGRRSRFEIAHKKLMVSEVFLDTFVPWQPSLPVHRTQRGTVSAAIMSPTQ
jgi:chorismate--pyruvate lyase